MLEYKIIRKFLILRKFESLIVRKLDSNMFEYKIIKCRFLRQKKNFDKQIKHFTSEC